MSRARRRIPTVALIALAVASLAAYAATIVFLADSLPDRTGQNAQNGDPQPSGGARGGDGSAQATADEVPASPPRFPASDYRQSRFPSLTGRPLIGANYTHYAFPNCTFHETHILVSYSRPGVAQKIHSQLFRMRKAGVATIRTIIWHMTDASRKDWGPISSAGGTLHEPNRTNLIRYLTEVRRFGFARLTISFSPLGTNDPLRPAYRPGKLKENWRFIETVRSLVKRYGPRNTRFDLFSEGAPNETPTKYEPLPQQTDRYIRDLYRLYVQRFGNRDVSFSAIGSFKPAEQTNRLQNLVRILRSSGEPLPRWYDLHIGFSPGSASYALQQGEAALEGDRQSQPLVIGDLGYDNRGIAIAIKRFIQRSQRRVEEISPWYLHKLGGCQVSPPYTPGAYASELHAR